MRIYLTGPRGFEAPKFDICMAAQAAARLLKQGHTVSCPAGWEVPTPRQDIVQLLDSEGVALLPGWQQSPMAQLEVEIAERLGLTCRPLDGFLLAESDAAGRTAPDAILDSEINHDDEKRSCPTAANAGGAA